MSSELERAEKRGAQNRWMIQLVSGLVVLIISIMLMIDVATDNLMNFFILIMLVAAGFLLILSIFGFFRERARKKRLERIRARRFSSA
ncbi:MAG: hypothetical protein ACXAEL_02575 [Candidatus Hodarchaeales archaeon]|jgi:small-conductance mechanosensitive channel